MVCANYQKYVHFMGSYFAGKWHVERICKKVFDDYSESDAGKMYLKVDKLHAATLMVYK